MNLLNKLRGFMAVIRFENRFQLVFSRLFFQSPIDVYRFQGLDILVDHSGGDANGIRACLTTNMYRSYVQQMKLPKSGAIVVDIGANAGGCSLLLLSEGVVPATIAAVELNPSTCHRLTFNLMRNFPTTIVTVVNAGISGNRGEAVLQLGAGGSGDSLFGNTTALTEGNQVCVKLLTYDDLIERHIGDRHVDLCKMDIEGSEWDIFFSTHCARIIQCKNILMEVHPRTGHALSEILTKIESYGFSLQPQLKIDDVYWFKRVSTANLQTEIRMVAAH